jgi:hypothetical protein
MTLAIDAGGPTRRISRPDEPLFPWRIAHGTVA